MLSFGSILLAKFPFSDLSDAKRRPVLLVSGKLGDAPASWLTANEATFFNMFGFGHGPPATFKRPPKAP